MMPHDLLKPWQLVLLVLVCPAVGTFLLFAQPGADRRLKVAALVYCLVVTVIILTLRCPVGQIRIDAVPLS